MRTCTPKTFPSDINEPRSHFEEKCKNEGSSSNEPSDLDTSLEEITMFFNEDKRFPIMSLSRGKLEAEQVLEMLSSDYPPKRKCQRQPVRVQQNALFVIDTRFVHFRTNVETKLASLGRKEHKQYFDEIFGIQEGTVYEMGLLGATSEDVFDAILASLQEPWARREKNETGTSNFHKWMVQRSQMMKESMIAAVRTKAGLGYPPDKFYTNDSENTNRRLRHKTRGQELGETAFAKAVKELIEDDQETELVLAFFRWISALPVKRAV